MPAKDFLWADVMTRNSNGGADIGTVRLLPGLRGSFAVSNSHKPLSALGHLSGSRFTSFAIQCPAMKRQHQMLGVVGKAVF